VGNGRAEKAQVSYMVGQMLGRKPDWALDTGDALAVAICHLNMRRMARLTGR
jgi:crossover junction endodeoxyribonuclease RuvC